MSAVQQKTLSKKLRDAFDLFEEGRFSESAALLDRERSKAYAPFQSAALRARLFLRTDPSKAVAILNAAKPARKTREYAIREMLLGEAHALLEDYDGADAHLEAATIAARDLKDPELIADVAYRTGRRFVMAGAPDRAREALTATRSGRSKSSSLNALHLESFILSREGRLREQAQILITLLRQIDPNTTAHMEHRAWATHTLAALARELYLPESVSDVERHFHGTPWPDDFRINRFQATKAIAWAKALQGDYFNAFRYLKESSSVAPDSAWRTVAFCDRAYLAMALGERRWARQEMLEAEESAERIDWERCRGEEPIALLLLAELFVESDPVKATGYLARFRHVGEPREARLLMRRDERFQALVSYSTGVVEAALGDKKLARSRLESALRVYERLGYEWRAARAELYLFDVTKADVHLERAREKLRHYSSSWLFEELRRRRSQNLETHLPPAQDRVFRLICRGLSNAQIAAELGRSENTIANQAKAVLKAFGVSSRSALIAEAIKSRLV